MRLIDYFNKGLLRDPDRVAFVDERSSLTWRETAALSARIAAGLQKLMGTDCPRAAVYSPNDAVAFCCVLGVMQAGAVWVPVNVRHPVKVNSQMLGLTECECIFYHSSMVAQVAELAALTPSIRHCVCIDGEAPAGHVSLQALMANDGRMIDIPDDPDRLTTIFPTGGTTGLSKAAVWTNRTWEHAMAAFWTSCPGDEPPVHLVAAPMTHGAGAVAMMTIPGGATNVVLKKADPLSIMEAVDKYRITHMYLPPTLIYMMLAHPDLKKYNYSSLKYLILASAPIAPAKLREAMDAFGPCMCQSFGQAEAPMLLTFLSTHDLLQSKPGATPDRYASCGTPTLGVRVEIMDDEGRLLPPGEKGEIVARGGLVFAGYFKNKEATAEVSKFGWHHTGDVGFKDEQNFIYIVDRKKDMIITGGFNVFSAEVEQVVLSHPAVQDCAVIGVPDGKWGEAVKAVIELKPGRGVPAEEIIALVRDTLGGVQAPKSVEFWPELPRSPNGKVLKRDVRQKFWGDQDRSIA